MSSYAVIKLRLRAEIGDQEFRDVVQFSSTFAMNTIPSAMLLVAVGRNVENDEDAAIHDAIDQLDIQQRARVYLTSTVTDQEDAVAGLPNMHPDDEGIMIFDGKVVGVGFRRGERGAHFTIHLAHWLADVNYASAASASSHPGNPADMTYPAIYRALGIPGEEAEGGGGVDPHFVPIVSKSLVNAAGLEDLWGNILHKWMQALAEQDPIQLNIFGGNAGGGDDNTLEALAKMKPNPDGVPLAVDLGDIDLDTVARGIQHALTRETGSNWYNTTLWGKLVGEWAPAFQFSVIPRVTDALVVPFTGGLRGEPWLVISDADYSQGETSAQIHQLLRFVGIIHPVMYLSGIDLNRLQIPLDRGGTGGSFQPADMEKGLILLKNAPAWLADPILSHDFTKHVEGMDDEPIGTAYDEEGTGGEQQPDRDLPETQTQYKNVLDKYAEQLYVREQLKGRMGEITGKLRFDIAPGSNVLIKSGGARNVPFDKLRRDLYATVVQVSCLINAESQKAGTAFTLAHLRSEQENQKEGMSIDKPPLYKEAWRGAALINEAPPE